MPSPIRRYRPLSIILVRHLTLQRTHRIYHRDGVTRIVQIPRPRPENSRPGRQRRIGQTRRRRISRTENHPLIFTKKMRRRHRRIKFRQRQSHSPRQLPLSHVNPIAGQIQHLHKLRGRTRRIIHNLRDGNLLSGHASRGRPQGGGKSK